MGAPVLASGWGPICLTTIDLILDGHPPDAVLSSRKSNNNAPFQRTQSTLLTVPKPRIVAFADDAMRCF